MSGYVVENNHGNYEETMMSATILGKLVKALSKYDYYGSEEYNEFVSKDEMKSDITKLTTLKNDINLDNPYYDKIVDDLNSKIDMCNSIINSFDFDDIKNVSIMLCHGDYSVQQLIYNKNELPSVLDFETLKYMPLVWEIIRSYSYADAYVKDGKFNINNFIDYVKEVMKYVPLTKKRFKVYASYLFDAVSW